MAPATAWAIKVLKAYWVQVLLKTVFTCLKIASWRAEPVRFNKVLFTNWIWAGIKVPSNASGTNGCKTLTNQNASAHPILIGAVILRKSRSFAKGGNVPGAGVGVVIL